MFEAVSLAAEMVDAGESLVLLVDERSARILMVAAAQAHELDADIMATQTSLEILEHDLGTAETANAWQS